MSTLTTTKKPLHPLIRVVSIGLVVFSAVRIGDFMGWTSTTNGGTNVKAALELQAANAVTPVTVTVHGPVTVHAPVIRQTSPLQTASNAPSP